MPIQIGENRKIELKYTTIQRYTGDLVLPRSRISIKTSRRHLRILGIFNKFLPVETSSAPASRTSSRPIPSLIGFVLFQFHVPVRYAVMPWISMIVLQTPYKITPFSWQSVFVNRSCRWQCSFGTCLSRVAADLQSRE